MEDEARSDSRAVWGRPAAGLSTALLDRLSRQRPELEAAMLARVRAIAGPPVVDPAYEEGLRAAVTAALDFGLASIEASEDHAPPVPTALLGQARLAARHEIGLATVLRRYLTGYSLLSASIMHEAEAESADAGELKQLLAKQARLFDRLTAMVSEEYERETRDGRRSPARRREERVEQLLAGDLVDPSSLNYELDRWHVGIVAEAAGSSAAIRGLARAIDMLPLSLPRVDGSVWVWLGSRRRPELRDIEEAIASSWPAHGALAIGEPARCVGGWRLTHRQAGTAFSYVASAKGGLVRYSDVALLASMSRDDLLQASLRQLYLAPLGLDQGGDEVVRETLRAYFSSGRKVSAAASALGVSRQTVTARLKAVSTRLGRPLEQCANELDAALKLAERSTAF